VPAPPTYNDELFLNSAGSQPDAVLLMNYASPARWRRIC